jgi:hypothetical protein
MVNVIKRDPLQHRADIIIVGNYVKGLRTGLGLTIKNMEEAIARAGGVGRTSTQRDILTPKILAEVEECVIKTLTVTALIALRRLYGVTIDEIMGLPAFPHIPGGLEEIRHRRNIRQVSLATAVNVSQPLISRIEKFSARAWAGGYGYMTTPADRVFGEESNNRIGLTVLKDLRNLLGANIDDILGVGTGTKK